CLPPADAVGGVDNVSALVDVALLHAPFPKAVSVNVTLPAAISAEDGKYVAVVSEFALAKVPVPLDDHITEAALDADAPAVMAIGFPLLQAVMLLPAAAVGPAVTVMVLETFPEEIADEQVA